MIADALPSEGMRTTAAVLIAAVALLVLPGPVTTEEAVAQATIRVGDDFFAPANRAVRRGSLVRFRWVGNRPHNVVKSRGPGPHFRSATTRSRGVNFSRRFRQRGNYRLVCTIHSGMAMTLRVR
jgi:plastocyanin